MENVEEEKIHFIFLREISDLTKRQSPYNALIIKSKELAKLSDQNKP